MTTNKDERRTIKIKEVTYHAIRKLGMMGETFDDVLQRLLKLYKIERKKGKMSDKDKDIAEKMG